MRKRFAIVEPFKNYGRFLGIVNQNNEPLPNQHGMIDMGKGRLYFGQFRYLKKESSTEMQPVFEGKGMYINNDDYLYIGDFHNGKFHGKGKLLKKGFKYVGEFSHNKKHGDGEAFDYSSKHYYNGPWKNNNISIKDNRVELTEVIMWLKNNGCEKCYLNFERREIRTLKAVVNLNVNDMRKRWDLGHKYRDLVISIVEKLKRGVKNNDNDEKRKEKKMSYLQVTRNENKVRDDFEKEMKKRYVMSQRRKKMALVEFEKKNKTASHSGFQFRKKESLFSRIEPNTVMKILEYYILEIDAETFRKFIVGNHKLRRSKSMWRGKFHLRRFLTPANTRKKNDGYHLFKNVRFVRSVDSARSKQWFSQHELNCIPWDELVYIEIDPIPTKNKNNSRRGSSNLLFSIEDVIPVKVFKIMSKLEHYHGPVSENIVDEFVEVYSPPRRKHFSKEALISKLDSYVSVLQTQKDNLKVEKVKKKRVSPIHRSSYNDNSSKKRRSMEMEKSIMRRKTMEKTRKTSPKLHTLCITHFKTMWAVKRKKQKFQKLLSIPTLRILELMPKSVDPIVLDHVNLFPFNCRLQKVSVIGVRVPLVFVRKLCQLKLLRKLRLNDCFLSYEHLEVLQDESYWKGKVIMDLRFNSLITRRMLMDFVRKKPNFELVFDSKEENEAENFKGIGNQDDETMAWDSVDDTSSSDEY